MGHPTEGLMSYPMGVTMRHPVGYPMEYPINACGIPWGTLHHGIPHNEVPHGLPLGVHHSSAYPTDCAMPHLMV